jgi:hypothetical protein
VLNPGITKVACVWLAALLLLPGASGSAEKKTRAETASENAATDAKAAGDSALATWMDSAQWRTVPPEELAMTSEPRAPGAAAIYLYTETDRNNLHRAEMIYRQIKVLTEEGRNLANISITFDDSTEEFRRIDARVIQPDGAVIPFAGEVYDRTLESGGQPVSAKSLTLPDVRLGSVIEVRYWRAFRSKMQYMPATIPVVNSGAAAGTTTPLQVMMWQPVEIAPPPRWMLNQQLFTRHARYSLQLKSGQFARWTLPLPVPAGVTKPALEANNVVRMEARNMPEFVTEDYMPPADDVILSVDFNYDRMEPGDVSDPVKYWKTFGQHHSAAIEEFIDNPKHVKKRLDRIIAKEDSAEQKYRKIYEHVRKMGNADIPGSMDEKTRLKCARGHTHARDVAEAKCGNLAELQLYFIALCRAEGLPAAVVRTSSRLRRFFTPSTPDASRLDNWLVAISLNGREVLVSPGVPFLPFATLDWWDTSVPGFKPDKNGGTWFTTTQPAPEDAVTQRKARFTLSEDGVLEGTVLVRHTGHEATSRTVALLNADEQTRADFLKNDLRYALAVPAEIAVVRQPAWAAGNGVLEIEYRVKVQDWGVTSGNRVMVGIGLFGNEQVGKFIAAKREHPIYFRFPFIAEDELEILLPAGYKVQEAPARQVSPDAALKYVTSVESREGAVSIRRSLTHNLLLTKQTQFPRVKSFYELVRAGDQEQVVVAR